MKKAFFLTYLFLFGLFATQLNAQVLLPIPIDPHVTIGKLDNGITYYIRENKKPADIVELRLVVNAGSLLEDTDQLGLAHFMEHMNFNGTKNFKKNELVDYLQSIGVEFGADLNAYTTFGRTVYILPIPTGNPEALEKGFQVIEDWAHNALLMSEMIDDERGVVLEEYRLGLGAGKRMRKEYLPIILKNTRFAKRLPIGKKEIIENFDYDVLKRFYHDWYRPKLMAVIAVGDLETDVMLQKIKAHFADIPVQENPRERKTYSIPNHSGTYIAVANDPEAVYNRVQITYMDTGKRHIAISLDDFKNNLVEQLFSIMINNRLDKLRNSPKSPFVFAFSYHGRYWSPYKAAYTSTAYTSKTGQLNALKVLLINNKRVKKHGFEQEEFTRAKKELLANLEEAYKSRHTQKSSSYVNDYIFNYLYHNAIPGIEWRYETTQNLLPNIELQQVGKLIDKYLHKNNRTILFTGNAQEGENKITKEEIKNVLKEVAAMQVEPYQVIKTRSSLMTTIPKSGTIIKNTQNQELGTTTLSLSNGIQVIYKKTDFKDNEIEFQGFSFGGSSKFSNSAYREVHFALGGLDETGIAGLSKNQLNKLLADKNVSVSLYIGSTTEGIRGNSTTEDLETLFRLIYLYLTDLNKDTTAYQAYINKRKAFVATFLNMPRMYFISEFSNFIHQNDPRYMGFPTVEKLTAANYNLAYNKYQQRFADLSDFKFFFVGDIPVDKFKMYVKMYIASLPTTTDKTKEMYEILPYRPLSGSHKKVIKKGQAPQSFVNIVYRGETTYSPKEDYYLQSLGDILNIKLVEILREEQGGVYGIGAYGRLQKIPYGAYNFKISFPCGPANVPSLIDAALAEVQKIIENGPTIEDLEKIKAQQLLEYKEDIKKNTFWLGNMVEAAKRNTDMTAFLRFKEKVNALTAKNIQKAAKKYLSGGHITGILYPEK